MAGQQEDPIFAYRVTPLTSTIHKTAYTAVDPRRPQLSQAGRTVLITGATGGIGYAVARAFAVAGAKEVIVVGRSANKAQAAAVRLGKECSSTGTGTGTGSQTIFSGRVCEIGEADSVERLWDGLAGDGVRVDVLVLNAAHTGLMGPLWQLDSAAVWAQFASNVRSCHQACLRFRGQGGRFVVNVSTSAIHDWPATKNAPSYGLTKNAAALLLQLLASEVSPAELQIVSFHPGAVFTPGARAAGLGETSLPWDDEQLPAATAAWAASDEAAFLHGRFFWAPWDVDELASGELRRRLESDASFLRVGVCGL